jgi:hypothetical protein
MIGLIVARKRAAGSGTYIHALKKDEMAGGRALGASCG